MIKNHDVRVRLSAEELSRVKLKAQKLGMKVSSYLRFLGLNSRVLPTKVDTNDY